MSRWGSRALGALGILGVNPCGSEDVPKLDSWRSDPHSYPCSKPPGAQTRSTLPARPDFAPTRNAAKLFS